MVGRQLPLFSVHRAVLAGRGLRRVARHGGHLAGDPRGRRAVRGAAVPGVRTFTGRGWWTSSRRSRPWHRWCCSSASGIRADGWEPGDRLGVRHDDGAADAVARAKWSAHGCRGSSSAWSSSSGGCRRSRRRSTHGRGAHSGARRSTTSSSGCRRWWRRRRRNRHCLPSRGCRPPAPGSSIAAILAGLAMGCSVAELARTYLAHAPAGAHVAGHDRRDAGARLHDALLGPGRHAGPGVRPDRRAVSVLRHDARLARRGADRVGHVVQRAVRQPAADHGRAAGARTRC